MLHPPWLATQHRGPRCNMQPAAPTYLLAQVHNPAAAAGRQLCLQQLQGHNVEAAPCALSPMSLVVEAGTVAGKQERPLSSWQVPGQIA